MKSKGKKEILTLLIVMCLFASSSAAGLTELPKSDHYQGKSYFGGGRLEFAVYDTQASDGEKFVDNFGEVPGSGQYIYAYQLFNDTLSSNVLEYFGLYGIGEGAIVSPENENISAMDDFSGSALNPNDWYITPTSLGIAGVWEFGDDPLLEGEHSYLLTLRSDSSWALTGGYTFNKSYLGGGTVTPEQTQHAPEPTTVCLFGIGLLAMLRKRKKY